MQMSFYRKFPDRIKLIETAIMPKGGDVAEVNAHLHTPYSFSAFDSVGQALDIAAAEGIKVAGINDFNTTDGFREWAEESLKRNIFPLFNIEFIALSREDQGKGIRINDPHNPGRIYLSGKGLAIENDLSRSYIDHLNDIKAEANKHTEMICSKLNEHLNACGAPFSINFREVADELTLGNIRERHLAKALRLKIDKHFTHDYEKLDFYSKMFNGKSLKCNTGNRASVENEIRGNLFKAGGTAFVAENPDSFSEVSDIVSLIYNARGIPTYPFLADNPQGEFTEFEADPAKAIDTLVRKGIFSVEFIPARNSIKILSEYAGYCWDRGMVVTFGTEHNTPRMEPLLVRAAENTDLTPVLKEINYRGACCIAAHQYLTAIGERRWPLHVPDKVERDELIKLGHSLISQTINR